MPQKMQPPKKNTGFYFAPYKQDNLVPMLLWEGIYYLFGKRSEADIQNLGLDRAESFYEDFYQLTSVPLKGEGSEQAKKYLGEFKERGLSVEDSVKVGSVLIILENYTQRISKNSDYKLLQKPNEFVENGWLWVMGQPYFNAITSSRFPLSLMNIFFQFRDPNAVLPFSELLNKSKKADSVGTPDNEHINQALDHLMRLGLIREVRDDSFQLVRNQLNKDGREIYTILKRRFDTLPNNELLRKCRSIDPQRALFTEKIAKTGQFDIDDPYITEIFEDLKRFVLDTDMDLLLTAAHLRRNIRLNKRWSAIKNTFQNYLEKETSLVKVKKKIVLHPKVQKIRLTLPLSERKEMKIRYGQLIICLQDNIFNLIGIGREYQIRLSLNRGDVVVWQQTLSYENAKIQVDLTKEMQISPEVSYDLTLETEPINQVQINIQLIAQYLNLN